MFLKLGLSILLFCSSNSLLAQEMPPEVSMFAAKVDTKLGSDWPVQNNGRIKPFLSMVRETALFLSGKYNFQGLSPNAFYFTLLMVPQSENWAFIEVRSPDLRQSLGFARDKRYFSVKELGATNLFNLAESLQQKEQINRRTLTELENKTLEAANQLFLAQEIMQGQHLSAALDLQLPSASLSTPSAANSPHQNTVVPLENLRDQLAAGLSEAQQIEAKNIRQGLLTKIPPTESDTLAEKIDLENIYTRLQPFLWAAWLSLILSLTFFWQNKNQKLSRSSLNLILVLPLLFEIVGFAIRIRITGFAPVTNMFGTMLWVGFGVGLFSTLLFYVYKHYLLTSLLQFSVFLVLLLAHSIPLVLSPDMDPIVAVLRSNFWLTIHVLTITISYAAFTISMLLGNIAIVRLLFGKADANFVKVYSHFTYRTIQLGVFLLTAGIILGGVWADYSWGRFWGWDPKETWALIADLGFLVLLHARYIQWVSPLGLMVFSPVAYLLVIMAWYGVNFILAAGLHSYGFSSGGAQIVTLFVLIQLGLIFAALFKSKLIKSTAKY